MSRLPEKILQREKPNAEDWNEFLLEAHRKNPSQTPRTFASYRTQGGQTSYEILAESVRVEMDNQLLDLACGDGFLIPLLLQKLGRAAHVTGIDMSEIELSVARAGINDPRVNLKLAKAHSLPVAAASIDLIVCHMALMLMLPIEPVVQELERVLRPGGRFSAIVPSRQNRKPLWEKVIEASIGFAFDRHSALKEVQTGDPRVFTKEGIRELFGPAFSQEEDFTFELEIKTTPEGLWDFMRDMYYVGMIPEADRQTMRERLIALGEANQDKHGMVHFQYPMRKFTLVKR